MLKKHQDFPDLIKSHFYSLSVEHFKQSLDYNEVIPQQQHIHAFFNEGTEKYDSHVHILTLALRNVVRKQDEELLSFVKEKVLELVKKGKITQNFLNQMAFNSINWYYGSSVSAIAFFLDNNLVDKNVTTENGYTLLMTANSPDVVKKLVELGCDVHAKLNNTNSKYHNLDVYSIAVKMKNKSFTKLFQSYLSEEELTNNERFRVEEIHNEKNIDKQLSLFRNALVENNMQVVQDILHNQEHYKGLIEYDDKRNVNLINVTIRAGRIDMLKDIISFDYYQKNKNYLTKNGACHTEVAIYLGKNNCASLLYDHGFKNIDNLVKSFEEQKINSREIVNKLAQDGYKISPFIVLSNYAEIASENNQYSKEELKNFFETRHDFLHLENITVYPKRTFIFYKETLTLQNSFQKATTCINHYQHNLKNNTIHILCNLLKQQEKIDPENFEKNFNTLLAGIGFHDKKLGLKLAILVLKNFIDKEKEIFNGLSYFGRKDWLVDINKNNLEKLLSLYDDSEKTVRKKMKI